ncbi:hypothetical protein HPB52_017604 [Rhipicephalus sanguineus]|uniref:MRH domain-containing protein n=1 Tax=Rhipicephalus sanguineus TaxID=34632 RepID=A0A9D4ST32_RHISA|nr:hypothetical protein HPB52_017604 [Rhipicephalus sanguineus]
MPPSASLLAVVGPLGLLLLTAVKLCGADELPACQPKDFHYEFTECDDQGGRWRVSVPRPQTCVGGAPNAPQRVEDCTTSCAAGSYFDRTRLACVRCPAGKYSLGGGLRFSQWDGELPQGMHVLTEAIESSFRARRTNGTSSATASSAVNCSAYGWKAFQPYVASQGGPCVSVLTYSAKLVKPGVLTYTYQYTDDTVIFNFEAQNDQCQSIEHSERYKWPQTTEEGKWKTMNVNLQAGLNVLYWKTVGMDAGEGKTNRPVKIKSIEISGVAYTSECTPCAPGTYSDTEGAVECKPCPLNTYSIGDASECKACGPEEFALPGSSQCGKRPACTPDDYYEIRSPCDHRTNMTTVSYDWVSPKVCDQHHPDSVHLPVSGMTVACPPCNPGMHHGNRHMCDYCPPGNYSDGYKECQDCPASTVPNYGFFLKTWQELPSNMASRCMSLQGWGCRNATAWKASGGYVQSGQGHGEDAYLILSLEVGGFRRRDVFFGGRTTAYGTVSFTFELDCSGLCELVFMSSNTRQGVSVVKSWTGRQEKQHYTYYVQQNDSYTFSWAFQRSASDPASPRSNRRRQQTEDSAIIYDIHVTNTVRGGAEKCIPCPEGSEAKGCIPCGPGQYIEDRENLVCKQCPANTYVTERLPYGVSSCKSCGPGLRSENGQACYSDCRVYLQQGDEFDFHTLPSYLEVRGRKLFTASGTQYYHVFNISLCGNEGKPVAVCGNNVTYHMQDEFSGDSVMSQVCRSTIVPSQQADIGTPLAIQSVSLGDELVGITTRPSYNDIDVLKEFLPGPGQKPDVHFFYYSATPTQACLKGRATTITMRCDKNAGANGTVSLPTSCPDGTCDGCSFHFLWRTALACRICKPDDYQASVVKGECVGGVQKLHYISPQGCIPRGSAADTMTRTQPCSVIPRQLQIIIAIGVGLGVLLFGLLVYFWKKNRRLEYKYMKLVQSSSGKDGELPAAESCAIEEDEEDHFENGGYDAKNNKGLLQKFRTVRIGSGKSGEGHHFETIHLTKGEMVS